MINPTVGVGYASADKEKDHERERQKRVHPTPVEKLTEVLLPIFWCVGHVPNPTSSGSDQPLVLTPHCLS